MSTEKEKLTQFEKVLLHVYFLGLEDELEENYQFYKADFFFNLHNAYECGKIQAKLGDHMPASDYKSNKEILNEILKTNV